MVDGTIKIYMCIKHLNKLYTRQDIDSKEARKMLTVLANISIKRTLYSVSTLSPMNDSLAKYQTSNGLNPFSYCFHN